ncbi:glycosyltransferase [Methylosinus sporium]|nr:glycosyltransferase [Methylosinus sporium]
MLDIYVFSYNRPQFLDNCLTSISRHAPGARVRVFDDNSSDPRVAEILKKKAESDSIEVILHDGNVFGLHGGLYCNMQRAYEHGLTNDVDIALFIQDDMQLVRDVTNSDLCNIRGYFAETPDAIQIYVSFLKAINHDKTVDQLHISRRCVAYLNNTSSKWAAFFCDVGIFHFGRMKNLQWKFEPGEGENNAKAQIDRLCLGYYAYPFMMYLPYPTTEYYRVKPLLLRVAEWWVGSGFYPYDPMSPADVQRLFQRELTELPEAEAYLAPRGLDKPEPWLFGGALIDLIQTGGVQGWIAGKLGRIIKTTNDCKAELAHLAELLPFSAKPASNVDRKG